MNLYSFFVIALLFCFQISLEGSWFQRKTIDIFEAISTNNKRVFREHLSQLGAHLDVLDKDGRAPLHVACAVGNEEFCKALLKGSANIEGQDKEGNTPLLISCLSGHVSLCVFLLQNKANIEAQDREGNTPLHIAAGEGNELLAKELLSKGANKEAQNKEGKTPLHIACIMVHNPLSKLLIDSGANFDAQDKEGNTALHQLVGKGNTFMCRLLLTKRAFKEVQNNEGKTQLHIACSVGNAAILQLLLERGANINTCTNRGETPLMLACKEGRKEVLDILLKQDTLIKGIKDHVLLEGTALHWACYYNRVKFCKDLLDAGFDPNEQANTLSLLHIAIKNNNTELFELFLEKQRDLNMCDKNGMAPVHLVCELGHSKLLKRLLLERNSKKISINARTLTGKTPLHFAVENSKVEPTRLLLIYGALPNEEDTYGKTPLIYAAERHYTEICQLLIEKIPTSVFNMTKPILRPLARGNAELEKLFGVYIDMPILPRNGTVPVVSRLVAEGSVNERKLPDNASNFSSSKAKSGGKKDGLDEGIDKDDDKIKVLDHEKINAQSSPAVEFLNEAEDDDENIADQVSESASNDETDE